MKKIIALSLALVLVFACVLTSCSKEGPKLDSSALDDLVVDKDITLDNGEKYSFEIIDSETIVITEYKGSHELHEVVVPSKIVTKAKPDGYTVAGIDAEAFYYDVAITAITIPEGVTYIGNYAFAGCSSLTSVTLPSTVTSIGDGAFYACTSIETIALPNAVESIGNGAFTACSDLKSVTFPASLKTIGEGAFRKCTALETVSLQPSLESIGKQAFYDCTSLKQVFMMKLEDGKVGSNAFTNCHEDLEILYGE
jgi:hypothetical protein